MSREHEQRRGDGGIRHPGTEPGRVKLTGELPGVGHRRQLAESTGKVRALAGQQPGLIVLPAHDPTAARRLLDS